MKSILSFTLGLLFCVNANAAIYNLGELTPQKTSNVFALFGAGVGDDYTFNVTDSFAFTSSVAAYDAINFGISLSSDSGGYLFGQDATTPTTAINGFVSGTGVEIYEKTLLAGNYTFSVVGNSTDGSSAYVGSFTVGRAAAVAAVPEPETYAMFLAGLGLLGFASRRRKG